MDLSTREIAVLEEAVRLYIETGEPVSSRRIARRSRLGVSPATIRNIMADMEERGYFVQPHPSAGRIPTDRSLRLYVRRLSRRRGLDEATRSRLEERLRSAHPDLWEDLEWVARLLAEFTREAGLAIRPLGDEPVVEAVFLAPLSATRVLGVIVTAGGAVVRRVLTVDGRLTADDLRSAAGRLTALAQGRSVGEIRKLLESPEETGEGLLDGSSRELGLQLFQVASGESEIVIAGTEWLLERPEFEETPRARRALAALADGDRLTEVLRERLDEDRPARVIIGDETEVTGEGRLGIVAALFFREGRKVGAVGVVGPRRMDYEKIVPVVEFIGESVTRMLDEEGVSDE